MHLFKSELLQEPRRATPPRRRYGVRSARPVVRPERALPAPRLLELEALHILRVGDDAVLRDRAA